MLNVKNPVTPKLLFTFVVVLTACAKVDNLEISMDENLRPNVVAPITIVRNGTGSGEFDLGDRDGFNYYFSSYPSGSFAIEEAQKENDYCRSTESNEATDGRMHNEVQREMLIREKHGEITIAIACHKKMYRFFARDSIVNVQMVVEDADDAVTDTVVFRIVR